MPDYLILGCGYTGSRVARTLAAAGERVICTNRRAGAMNGVKAVAFDSEDEGSVRELRLHLATGMVVLHSVPTLAATRKLLDVVGPFHPRRFVYLSTTGVYGAAELVDERTAAAPETERDRERVCSEELISAGAWSSLVLRPAAIYGPHRGVHTSVRSGVFRPPPGGNRVISRIHVDDLAEHVVAGLRSDLTGAYPVADEEPCTSLELAQWTFALRGIPFAESAEGEEAKKGRRVDGSAYRRAVGLSLRYPSFRQGVPASLAAEEAAASQAF